MLAIAIIILIGYAVDMPGTTDTWTRIYAIRGLRVATSFQGTVHGYMCTFYLPSCSVCGGHPQAPKAF